MEENGSFDMTSKIKSFTRGVPPAQTPPTVAAGNVEALQAEKARLAQERDTFISTQQALINQKLGWYEGVLFMFDKMIAMAQGVPPDLLADPTPTEAYLPPVDAPPDGV